MPPRPPVNVTRPTLRKFYQNTQDAALAAFLATRNRAVASSDTQDLAMGSQENSPDSHGAGGGQSVEQDCDGSRRVRRRIEDLNAVHWQDAGDVIVSNLIEFSILSLILWIARATQ